MHARAVGMVKIKVADGDAAELDRPRTRDGGQIQRGVQIRD
jgi:hypothetical protein